MNDDPIIIIGSGIAGYYTARELRRLDKQTPIIILTADDGYHYYKPNLSTALRNQQSPQQLVMFDSQTIAQQLSLSCRPHSQVTQVNLANRCVTVNQEPLHYRQLVFATGASTRHINIDGLPDTHKFMLNDLMSYRHFCQQLTPQDRILILGVGIIGCEYASDLNLANHHVSMVAPATRLMDTVLPEGSSATIHQTLQSVGIDIHLQATVLSATPADEGGYTFQLSNGERLVADKVISAAGLIPQTCLAADAGIEVADGIVVNDKLQTSAPDVYAIGDCAAVNGQVAMYVAPIMSCAKALGKTLAGQETAMNPPKVPVIVKTAPCPLTFFYASSSRTGQWIYSGIHPNLQATLEAEDGDLLGFALTGEAVQAKSKLLSQINQQQSTPSLG